MKIAVIGLGQIGLPVAAGLAGQGLTVLAFGLDPARVALAVTHGAMAADSAAAAMSVPLVVTLLHDDSWLSSLCLGAGGAGLSPR